MMSLPFQDGSSDGLGACFVGVPLDIGCSNRPGTRFGPRALRNESRLTKTINPIGMH